MPTIITRRQGGVLIDATLLPAMSSMIRSMWVSNDPMVEQTWHYPDTSHGTDNAKRHWQSLSDQMKTEVRKSMVSCRIDDFDSGRCEYVLGPDMEPPARLVDVGDCHLLDDSIPF